LVLGSTAVSRRQGVRWLRAGGLAPARRGRRPRAAWTKDRARRRDWAKSGGVCGTSFATTSSVRH